MAHVVDVQFHAYSVMSMLGETNLSSSSLIMLIRY